MLLLKKPINPNKKVKIQMAKLNRSGFLRVVVNAFLVTNAHKKGDYKLQHSNFKV